MNIIIAGAGEVGRHLARLLSRENHNIVLIDESAQNLDLIKNADIMTMEGSPVSISVQKEAGMSKADLFIAVTPDESRNMTACMIAHNKGAKKTVARIDNYEYLDQRNKEFFKGLGVDSLIYPEMLAAQEIVSSIKMSWVRQWWEFCGGALILVGVRLRKDAEIIGKTLSELGKGNTFYHIAAIKRDESTLIPTGKDEIMVGDLVFFITSKTHLPLIRKISGKEEYPDVETGMIMGGSRIAVRTVETCPDYMHMKIMEKDLARCEKISNYLNDQKHMVINADGRDMDVLVEEGIENNEAFIALTGNSEANILACLTAKRMGVKKTVAEVENLDYIAMAENLDIGTIINKKLIAASHIYQMMLKADVENVKCLTFADADVAEFKVTKDSLITRKPVSKLGLPKGTTIGGLIRKGKGMIVSGDTMIEEGDHVVVFCLNMMIKKIEKYFA